MPGKFLSPKSAKLGHPQVILYATRNSKGKPILTGATLKNDFEESKYFSFIPPKKVVKKDNPTVTPVKTQSKSKPEVTVKQNPAEPETKNQEEKRDFFDHLSSKSWDWAVAKANEKKSHKKKKKDNPNQLLLGI